MNWGSWDNFWAMGGYGFYVWGSYGMAAAIIVVELWQLKVRRRAAVVEAQRDAGIWFIVPGFVAFVIYPIGYGLWLGSDPASYRALFADPVYPRTVVNTLLYLLLDRGFGVYLTSDHGNVEAEGCGCPAEGAVADLRGERVRVYPDDGLRCKVKERFPAALEWGPVGLPEDYLALLAPGRQAFVQEKQRIVSHGGASIEEIIVPLVQVERRDA